MLELTFKEIVEAVKGEVIRKGNSEKFLRVSTDTRKIEKGSVFIALKGENFNGNTYINEASEKGAIVAIIDEKLYDEKTLNDEINIILVNNTREALLDLAKYYRNKLDIKVVGITGSTGKTSTKDLIAAVLSEDYKVFKTKGNFNNEIGMPLMILELDSSYDIAVLEMGMSNLLEIHNLARVATPDIAAITNIGISHIENLKTKDNILKAKLEIVDYFEKNNLLVLNGDDDMLAKVTTDSYRIIKTGISEENNIFASEINLFENSSKFKINDENDVVNFDLNLPGKHNIQNLLLAIAIAKELKVSYENMQKGLLNLEATSMRLDIIKLKDFTLINDCYNSSPASVKSSIDVQKALNGKRNIAIIGTMKELGHESENAHREIGEYAKINGIDKMLLVGEFTKFAKIGFGEEAKVYESKKELIKDLKSFIKKGDVILIKASRSMKFEEITKELEKFNL
ncbi:UDP-N-acetylmuramoyl-tripeptide--D-alanyl-D-alanine ligase [Clostridium cavendishii DSM 21758]|uniref:UDP-N-acetylmuramoyl-tripeptide--D-alanyl-D-alanine ligase n=1 Tax=Clostridium cavendishii DSM 21758 TaxID=1121302 RepID=A0A1M6KPS3_9CLOT|nr:UDP-N-acetylmuramoyl-tripeptide--D-alanyl-D-alanine ligase [Clostridium cavendishii]SHJ60940.1 UDP-N-acetylmuramoyl-tripeptide--D-alanyl-D-alanine ligase [Clostridium cavendishii DSM 21758]